MHLYLSSSSPLNCTYNLAEGQAIYRVQSPYKLTGRTATIEKIVPPDSSNSTLRDSFSFLAEIEFHSISSSIIRYQGQDINVNDFFKRKGVGWMGSHRIFTAPDAKEYVWKLDSTVSKLFLNDGSKTPVAFFHRRRLGFFRHSRPASLEIFPAGEHMMDLIVITFVYIEKLRKEREQSQAASASASASGAAAAAAA